MPFNRADRDASDDATPAVRPPLSEQASAQVRSLGSVRDDLVADAQSWARQLTELAALAWRAQHAGGSARRTLPMELAGSWQISQWTAERWIGEAERVTGALPLTLQLLGQGRLLKHQALAVLHGTDGALPQIASAVEAEVLPAGAELCPSDLKRQVARVRLRLERERLTAEQADAAGEGEGRAAADLDPADRGRPGARGCGDDAGAERRLGPGDGRPRAPRTPR